MSDCDLRRAGILVTRPAHQAVGLCELIESCNGVALRLPALEILPPADQARASARLGETADIVIFVSPNAVRFGLPLLNAQRISAELTLGAVGKATALALKEQGYRVDLIPDRRFDSEGLLALPELQSVSGKRILVVRGEGGRPLLGDALRERGADLVYAEVYRRVCPHVDPTPLLERWERDVHLVTATSNDILLNLQRMIGEKGWPLLRRTPLLVISERMVELAESLGFATIVRAENAADRVILTRVCDWISHAEQ
ncbi:MAG: uroporphyrinogen-III synthase [Gammaproteobacteria bacterium]|nr:uroporphyrinogen-III synthase [Gammaproteobacteria bacterium]